MSIQVPIHRRIDNKDRDALDAAIRDGFDFIGTLHSYSLDIPEDHFPVEIRDARKTDYDKVLEIALAELRHSRLYADSYIPFEVAQEVYRERIKLAFRVSTIFVAVHISGEGIVGFCTLLDNEIEMIAVATKHQRKGIGRKLIEWCIDVCASRGNKTLTVKTQGDNYRGRKLYMQLGFKRTKIQEDFHKHENTCDG